MSRPARGTLLIVASSGRSHFRELPGSNHMHPVSFVHFLRPHRSPGLRGVPQSEQNQYHYRSHPDFQFRARISHATALSAVLLFTVNSPSSSYTYIWDAPLHAPSASQLGFATVTESCFTRVHSYFLHHCGMGPSLYMHILFVAYIIPRVSPSSVGRSDAANMIPMRRWLQHIVVRALGKRRGLCKDDQVNIGPHVVYMSSVLRLA